MAYTRTDTVRLGSSQTGLTLKAQLVDTAGSNVGSEITTGFVEMGGGEYQWTYASYPDGFRGSVKFYTGTLPTGFKSSLAINPEEAENTDVKTSSVIAASLTTQDIARILHPTEGAFFVAKTGNNGNTGLDWNNAWLTIGQAISQIDGGESILIGAGTFSGADATGVNGLRIIGSGYGAGGTILESLSGRLGVNVGSSCVITDLEITATGDENEGVRGLQCGADCIIQRCKITAVNLDEGSEESAVSIGTGSRVEDSILVGDITNGTYWRCQITGDVAGGTFYECQITGTVSPDAKCFNCTPPTINEDHEINIDYSPLSATIAIPLMSDRDIYLYQASKPPITFVITNADGTPNDLTGKSLRFIAYGTGDNPNEAGVFKKEVGSGLAISTNSVTLTLTTADAANPQRLRYGLWNLTDDIVLAAGKFEIREIAKTLPA